MLFIYFSRDVVKSIIMFYRLASPSASQKCGCGTVVVDQQNSSAVNLHVLDPQWQGCQAEKVPSSCSCTLPPTNRSVVGVHMVCLIQMTNVYKLSLPGQDQKKYVEPVLLTNTENLSISMTFLLLFVKAVLIL